MDDMSGLLGPIAWKVKNWTFFLLVDDCSCNFISTDYFYFPRPKRKKHLEVS